MKQNGRKLIRRENQLDFIDLESKKIQKKKKFLRKKEKRWKLGRTNISPHLSNIVGKPIPELLYILSVAECFFSTSSPNSRSMTSYFYDLDLAKTIITISVSSPIAILTFMNQTSIATHAHPPMHLHLLSLSFLFAFSTSVAAILFRQRSPVLAGALERMAAVSVVVAFFILMGLLLPEGIRRLLWIPFVLVLWPFLSLFFRGMYEAVSLVRERARITRDENILPPSRIEVRVTHLVHHYFLFLYLSFTKRQINMQFWFWLIRYSIFFSLIHAIIFIGNRRIRGGRCPGPWKEIGAKGFGLNFHKKN